MTTLSHAAVGYLITHYFAIYGMVPNTPTTYLLGVIVANLPDIDGAIAPRRLFDHHNNLKSVSHYPTNWLIVLGLTAALAFPFRIPSFPQYLMLATVNILLHFVLDTFSIYQGIAWLGPWKKKKYSFIKILPVLPSNNHQWVHWYLKHWVLYLEIALWVVALIVLLRV